MDLFLITWIALILIIALVAVVFRRPPAKPTDPAVREAWREKVKEELK